MTPNRVYAVFHTTNVCEDGLTVQVDTIKYLYYSEIQANEQASNLNAMSKWGTYSVRMLPISDANIN